MTVADPTTSVFLLHWNGSGPTGCRVERFPDKLAADAYAFEVLPGDRTAHVVAEEGDLSERTIFNGPTLVAIFNAITNNDPGVKKFESLTYAKERVFRTLRDRFGAVPYTVIPTAIQQVLLRDTNADGAAPHLAQIQAAAKAHGITVKPPAPKRS